MDLIDRFQSEGFLVSPDVASSFSGDVSDFLSFVREHQPGVSLIDHGVLEAFNVFIKGGFGSHIRLLRNYEQVNTQRGLSEWLGFYSKRYELLAESLSHRSELKSVVGVNRVDKLVGRDEFGLIGLISGLRETNNGNFLLELEDLSGSIRLLVTKSSPSFELVNDLVLDEVIGVNVRRNGNWCFVDSIVFPDLPAREAKSCDDDSCAVFLSDSHVGSVNFLETEFQRFFDWLSGERGSNKERALASHVKYLFFVGDLVDGVGIYPSQEDELAILSIYDQYARVAEFLKQVPESVQIVISPGNHDACRLALPQPSLVNEFTKPLQSLPNTRFVSNPSTINIHAGKGFPGYDVLLYHGNSYDHYVNGVPRLRKSGYEAPTKVMEFLLRKRHLAPTHGSALVAPSVNEDFLLINSVPDVFVSGHVHHSGVGSYKGVSLLNASCFQSQSSFQKRVGINPEPSLIPVMSLRDKSVHVMDFNQPFSR